MGIIRVTETPPTGTAPRWRPARALQTVAGLFTQNFTLVTIQKICSVTSERALSPLHNRTSAFAIIMRDPQGACAKTRCRPHTPATARQYTADASPTAA